MEEKLSSGDWSNKPEFKDVMICDPDGWDRTNFTESWSELISKDEFERRLSLSTCIYGVGAYVADDE